MTHTITSSLHFSTVEDFQRLFVEACRAGFYEGTLDGSCADENGVELTEEEALDALGESDLYARIQDPELRDAFRDSYVEGFLDGDKDPPSWMQDYKEDHPMNPPRLSKPPRMPTIPPASRLPSDNGCEPQRHPPATRPVIRLEGVRTLPPLDTWHAGGRYYGDDRLRSMQACDRGESCDD